MSQQDQHLTTEQLSAFLDKQLTSEEQAACSTHLVACEQCRYALDSLQLTVNLLQSLPQLEVSRSFVLPGDFKLASDSSLYHYDDGMGERSETQEHENAQITANKKSSTRTLPTPLRRTLRTVSALAAVVGIFFALSGFIATLSLLHMGGGGMASSASTASAPAPSGADQSTSPSVIGSQAKQHEPINGHSSSTTGNGSDTTITATQSPTTPQQSPDPNKTAGQPTSPTGTTSSVVVGPPLPLIDFNQPGIRLSIGILLAILGGMGYRLFTRHQR